MALSRQLELLRHSRPSCLFARSKQAPPRRRRRLGSEWLERRELMHGGHGAEPFPPGADLHAELDIILNGQTLVLPTNIGTDAQGVAHANPHTEGAVSNNRLHMHAINGVDPEHLFAIGDFFNVWRTNAGAAGNNPNANFSATQLMDQTSDGSRQVLMTVNGEFNNEFQNYVLRDDDHIVLTMAALSAPTLAEIPNQTVLAGAPSVIALDGFDADGDAITFTVTSSNPAISANLLSENNRSLRFRVSHASSGQGPNGDPAFTGEMTFELFEDLAPRSTARIIELAQSRFYDDIIFHRIIDDFMVQGGDPQGTGSGGSGVDFDDEYHVNLQHTTPGLLSMAKSTDDTNDSQFFITEVATRSLDFQHSIFGRLIEGDAIREAMSEVATPRKVSGANSDRPIADVQLDSAIVYHDNQNRSLMISAPAGTTGTSTITVTATDGHGNSTQRTFQVNLAPDQDQNIFDQNPPILNNTPFLSPIPTVFVSPGQTATVQLSATDVEGDDISYLDHDLLTNFFAGDVPAVPDPANPNNFIRLPVNPNLDVEVDIDTGLMTITPKPGVAGAQYTLVGVSLNPQVPVDVQQVHVVVLPTALTGISLSASSDAGASSTDRVTSLDNSTAAKRLSFDVTGVQPGATVKLYDGTTELGSAVAAGSTVTVQTNGNTRLSSGAHSIKATMSYRLDPNLDTGSLSGFIDVPDNLSATTQITIGNDFHNPTVAQDADNNGSVQPLDVLVIINYINSHPNVTVPSGTNFYIDVSNDGVISALDVLRVINHINDQPGLSGLTAQGLSAQGLAAPTTSLPEMLPAASGETSTDVSEDEVGTIDSAPASASESLVPNSFADDLSTSAAESDDLDELIELLATAR